MTVNETRIVIHRKIRRYELWPRRQPPMRFSVSPARTTIPGRSRMNRGSIILTSLKLSSQTLTASYLVRGPSHTHTHTHTHTYIHIQRKVCYWKLSYHLPFLCFPGSAAKEFFTKSKLPILELSHIWWVFFFYLCQRGNNSKCYKWILILHLGFLHTRLNLVIVTCWVIWLTSACV